MTHSALYQLALCLYATRRVATIRPGLSSPRLAHSLLLIPGLLVASAASLEAGDWQSSHRPIALYTNFQREMPDSVESSMRSELDKIVAPIGLDFAWRKFGEATVQLPASRLAVLHFKGRCDVEDLYDLEPYRGKLGWTQVSDGRVIPYVDVFCDAIRAYIFRGLVLKDRRQQDELFGRAIGRVIAHELYHVFTESQRHGSTGIMKSQCTVDDLLSAQLQFGSKEMKNLRSILAESVYTSSISEKLPSQGQTVFASNGCVGCHGARGEGTSSGPAMQPARMPRNEAELRARLENPKTQMSRKARDLELSWTDLPDRDVRDLLAFIRTALHSGASLRTTRK